MCWSLGLVLCSESLLTKQILSLQQVRKKNLQMGNKLLTARAGLFVSNSDDHIKIELSSLDAAFQIKGSTGKVIERKNKTIFICLI